MSEHDAAADALAERLFGSLLGVMDLYSVYLGDRLGYYRELSRGRALSPPELAESTSTHERYAREWLEQQAVTGLLEVDDHDAPPDERRYSLSPGHAEVLTDTDSLRFLAPAVRQLTAAGLQLPGILRAFREGGGVPWADFGPEMREAQALMNRPAFLGPISTELLPSVPEIRERLENGARVADIGCGYGWSSIGLALAFPEIQVEGFDIDEPSIDEARLNAEEAGVADRVGFHAVDAATAGMDGTFDIVAAFECIHDLPDPVAVLRSMRRLARDDGTVIVMDERVGETFHTPGDEVERLMYGFSLFVCLPDGMAHEMTAATGTVMRPETLRSYARDAGFADIEILPIEHDLFRFYLLKL